jgi:RimJ/RimL family protein N-acetyltransferase
MSKSPDPVTFRSVLNDDQQHFRAWYESDRKGLEEFFGVELPTEEEYAIQLSNLFGQMQQYTARMLIAEIRDAPIGIVLVNNLGPELEAGRVHIYLTPKKRRYALRTIQAGIAEAKKMGIQLLVQTVRSTNVSAIKLSEKVGFVPSPVMTFVKELH